LGFLRKRFDVELFGGLSILIEGTIRTIYPAVWQCKNLLTFWFAKYYTGRGQLGSKPRLCHPELYAADPAAGE